MKVAFSGQDPIAYLTEEDPFMRSLRQNIAERHLMLRRTLDQELATRIVKRLAEAMPKGKK